jgi:hypothetical protein
MDEDELREKIDAMIAKARKGASAAFRPPPS